MNAQVNALYTVEALNAAGTAVVQTFTGKLPGVTNILSNMQGSTYGLRIRAYNVENGADGGGGGTFTAAGTFDVGERRQCVLRAVACWQ